MSRTLGQILRESHLRLDEEEKQRRNAAMQELERRKSQAFKDELQRLRRSISAVIHKGLVPEPRNFPEESSVYGGLSNIVENHFDKPLRCTRPGPYLEAWCEFVSWAADQELALTLTHSEMETREYLVPSYEFTLHVAAASR